MEDPYLFEHKELEQLRKENEELRQQIIYLGDIILKGRNLANAVLKNYGNNNKTVCNMARNLLDC